MGLKKIKNRAIENRETLKKRFKLFFLIVCSYIILADLIYYVSLVGIYINYDIARTISRSITTFYFQVIQFPFFIVFCFAIFLYAITEAIWLKKYFIVDSTQPKLDMVGLNNALNYHGLKKKFLDEEYYLDTTINANKFAKVLGIKTDVLNLTIRKNGFKSFTEFANHYRVQVFIEKLNENQHSNLTIDGLASNCGFKSKSTFYRIFKEETKMTPLEYKENLLKMNN